MGSFPVRADGTLGGALRAFGEPTTLRRGARGAACRASWAAHRLTIDFYNLGGQNACHPRYGYFLRAIAAGREWRTSKGLKIGDSVSRLTILYRRARFQAGERGFWPAGWWLVPRRYPYGGGGAYPGLLAQTRRGRVVAFHVRYHTGGD